MVVERGYPESLFRPVIFEAINKFDHRHILRVHDVLNFLVGSFLRNRYPNGAGVRARFFSAIVLRCYREKMLS